MKKAGTSLGPAVFVVFNLFVFGPYTIYQGNIDEFTIPLPSILVEFVLPALALLLALILIARLLPEKARQLFVSILFVMGVLLWLQGNFLVWKYGLFNGQGIDWSRKAWQGWADGALWAGLLLLACLFYRKVYRIAAWGSAVITAVLLLSLLITSLQGPETWATQEKSSRPLSPPEEIFEFSSQSNVIHFVLDGFQSDIFSEIIAEDFDHYSTSLEGFTFFKEAMGSFPTTYMSVPAFLGARIYKNNMPMRGFLNQVKRGKNLFNMLYDRGYETDIVADTLFAYRARYSHQYQIVIPYGGTRQQNIRSNSALMLDLVLFRHAPHFLKPYIYNNQTWLVQRLFGLKNKTLNLVYFSHAAFLDDMIEHLSVKTDQPVYKYIHLMTPHFPMVVNTDCGYAGKIPSTRANIKIQAKCALDHFIKFLDRLRSRGLYDSSLIILQSDHGLGQKIEMTNLESLGDRVNSINNISLSAIAGSAIALLAIKPSYNKDNFAISRAQVSLTDIPATMSNLLKLDDTFDGRPVFEVDPDEVRERRFYYHEWQAKDWKRDYFPRLDEFVVKGSVFDRNSWRLGLTYYPPRRSK
jgi:hypothetical protein